MSATAGATPRGRELAFTRHRVARYLAAGGGLVALLLFFQQWVGVSLAGIGETSLTGLQLARGEASTRVNQGAVDASRAGAGAPSASGTTSGAAGAGAAAGAGSGGLTLPTRIPTVAAGVGGSSGAPAVQPTPAPAPLAAVAPAGSGGLSLPTRVPTVAPGGAPSGFGSTGPVTQSTVVTGATGAAAPGGPAAAAAPAPAPPAPAVLPRFALYLVALAGLGIAVFSVAWDWLGDPRDRFAGTLWTLLLSYGGALGSGSVFYKVISAPADNVLLGPGVGGVRAVEPALWGVFFAFLLSAVCLTVAWLSPAPPPPDPYARARG